MASLLADEHFPRPTVFTLRALGHVIVTAQDAGLTGEADTVILASATAIRRAVLTLDRDYIRLHKSGLPHAGIVFASEDQDFAALADRIHAALEANLDLTGLLIRVYRPNTPPPRTP